MLINGQAYALAEPLSLEQLLLKKGYRTNLVAVELNGIIVKRAAYPDTMLSDADKLEIVSVGGGG